jgi:hypothetical protein
MLCVAESTAFCMGVRGMPKNAQICYSSDPVRIVQELDLAENTRHRQVGFGGGMPTLPGDLCWQCNEVLYPGSGSTCSPRDRPYISYRSDSLTMRGRTTSWKEFIRVHLDVLAGPDFFTSGGPDLAQVGDGLRTVLHRSRHPQSSFGRHHAPPGRMLDGASGAQRNHAGHRDRNGCGYLLHDRDQTFCREFGTPLRRMA